jgi:NAD-dependent dihydropyrimidine dehydrogenase PreA subunit
MDGEKARKAASNPKRPGEQCRAEPASYVPVVDHGRCEGKSDCVDVCPYGVFQVRSIEDADYEALSFFGKLKSRAHGRKTAYTTGASRCQACGLCVVACPEEAILLKTTESSSSQGTHELAATSRAPRTETGRR